MIVPGGGLSPNGERWISCPRPAQGPPPHQTLRPVRQRLARRECRASPRASRCPAAADKSREACRNRRRRAIEALVPLPLLRRLHAYHRDLRARQRATISADRTDSRHQDRHVMSRIAQHPRRKARSHPRRTFAGHDGARTNLASRDRIPHRSSSSAASGGDNNASIIPANAPNDRAWPHRSLSGTPYAAPKSPSITPHRWRLIFPRVPSLEACGRRSRARGNVRDGPASATLYISSRRRQGDKP
jgi:hypothetical protein